MGTPVLTVPSAIWAPTVTIADHGSTCRPRHLHPRRRRRRHLRCRRRRRRRRVRLRHPRPRRPCCVPTRAWLIHMGQEARMQRTHSAKMGARTLPERRAPTARTARTAGARNPSPCQPQPQPQPQFPTQHESHDCQAALQIATSLAALATSALPAALTLSAATFALTAGTTAAPWRPCAKARRT